MAKQRGLYWFTNDLRLHDQPALAHAANLVDALVCYSHVGQAWNQHESSMSTPLGIARGHFLQQSLIDLNAQLKQHQQQLWVSTGDCLAALSAIIHDQAISDVFRSEHVGWYENQQWASLQVLFPQVSFHTIATHTLFDQSNLPFTISDMPAGFSGVRRKLEKATALTPIDKLAQLPPMPETAHTLTECVDWVRLPDTENTPVLMTAGSENYQGGEGTGLAHLATYLASGCASTYKQTRNALDGWQTSCKFSPWLALGCLSVRKVIADLKRYEAEHDANDSTYWIYVELLWREYYQWYAHRHGDKLYSLGGPTGKLISHQHDAKCIEQWITGKTDFPLVNACMTELRLTGFLSNRGRQIVASCFVNELAQDWRFGAAYFEQVLIDFDIAANWGNWQYIAGAGPATVEKKQFNLDKQTEYFDPQLVYTHAWLSSDKTDSV